MLLKLLKLKANDAIRSGAVATSSSGSVTLRNTWSPPAPSTRAASVSSSGTACSAPVQTRNQYGNPSQTLTRMHDTFAQVGSKSHGMSRSERLVDDAELVVQEPLPDEDREEGGDREREHEQRALDPPQLEAGLVEHDREEEADRELDEDGEERERERPEEDADERIANERVGEDRLEVLRSRRASSSPARAATPDGDSYAPSPLSEYTMPVSMFVNVSVAGSYTSVGCTSLAMVRPSGWMNVSSPVGIVSASSSASIVKRSFPLIDLVALGRGDRRRSRRSRIRAAAARGRPPCRRRGRRSRRRRAGARARRPSWPASTCTSPRRRERRAIAPRSPRSPRPSSGCAASTSW